MSVVVVIPARLESTRLPRKLLLRETGKTVLQHTWERARAASRVERVVVAVDDPELLEAARGFGAEALLTRVDHASGSDRVAEAAAVLEARGEGCGLVVNVQGDEPELDPGHVDALVARMTEGEARPRMGTLAERLEGEDVERPQVVKVVVDRAGDALYFSRAAIPFRRDPEAWPGGLRHIGIYAFEPAFLQEFCGWAPTALERCEGLEQLRALEHGVKIRVAVVEGSGARGIDTESDYRAFVERMQG